METFRVYVHLLQQHPEWTPGTWVVLNSRTHELLYAGQTESDYCEAVARCRDPCLVKRVNALRLDELLEDWHRQLRAG